MPNVITLSEAATVLQSARRILVVGCSGGGKTTLSVRLAEHFLLAYQSLDRDVRWLPNWVVRDEAEQRQIFEQLAAQERWVMDGSGPSSLDIRLPRADVVIWVRVPRRVALWGLFKRVCANYGTVRFGMAEGCKEPIPDREFLSYIWNFEKDSAPKIERGIDVHGPEVPVVMVRSHREMEGLIADGGGQVQ